MNYRYSRRYAGPLEAVILDWAGTVIDFGCVAPAEAFTELFRREGVPLTVAQAREPMGTEKREHIRRVLRIPAVAAGWQQAKGAEATEADIDRLYHDFLPIQLETIRQRAQMIPGAVELIGRLRERGLKVGANTGYNREMIALCEAAARGQGYAPDVSLAAEDAPRGRPSADLALLNAVQLGVSCVQACVKVDDTVPGIEEGLNAGMWTVAVAVSGNEVGLAPDEWAALDAEAQQARRAAAVRRLSQAGAHYVIDSVADLEDCLGDIEARLAAGDQP
ncbi:phosphonoacetaldehyde hydrolase [Solimonas sp. K1W22B-7]|uniref:phosphonoacetaldehyde hydrolase n=1 Tax=Solimonas sp. K1W22B-7 TaxID=2303331 RepID=UPI000E33739E|nr:phosphonoacetaldehyde hydrolase [Solimonas sp. K1W22B-7]AXQ28921.1 phosphonoacetaldehyde hydrolase [Solimonas sp. K1W22B-7]